MKCTTETEASEMEYNYVYQDYFTFLTILCMHTKYTTEMPFFKDCLYAAYNNNNITNLRGLQLLNQLSIYDLVFFLYCVYCNLQYGYEKCKNMYVLTYCLSLTCVYLKQKFK